MEIVSFLHCAAFSVVLNIMLCLLPQVCELLIINDIFLSIFFSLWCPALVFPVFLKYCAAVCYYIFKKAAVVVAG